MSDLDKYRLAFDVSPMPLLLVSADGVIRLTNAGLDELFGYPVGALIGQPVEVLVPEDVRAIHPDLRGAYMRVPTKRGMGRGRDLTGVTRTGGRIALELGLDPVEIDGATWAMVAAVDIRARKAQDERLRLTLDASASAMITVDGEGRIIAVNRATCLLFGYEPDELVGQTIEMLVPDDQRRVHPVYRASFHGQNRARPMGLGGKLYCRHRSGRAIPVEIALNPVSSPDGWVVVATVIDLTERDAHEREITEKADALAEMNTELSHFAYSASHDLKAPLATVAGLLDLCLEDLSAGNGAEARENIAAAVETVQRAARKVEAILSIARAGRSPLAPETFAVEQDMRAIWADLTAGTGDVPRLDFDLDGAGMVTAERQTLGVILENLASNAIRYADPAKPDRWVRLRARSDADGLKLSFADNGLGIPAAAQPFVFQMFKRLDDRSQDGLGLSLVQKHVERMGGCIDLTSDVGVGTEFTVTLPHPSREVR